MAETTITTKSIFLNDGTIKDHIDLQTTKNSEYLANLFLLFYEYNVDFTILKLAKILVSALVRKDNLFAEFLLQDPRYDLPVILKTCDILDSRRLYKQLESKTEKITDLKKLSKHKSIMANVKSLNEGLEASLSKSKINFIKKNWVNKISKDRLEYMALLYPIKHWKLLIDIFHLKPSDFQLDWFTTYIFTKEAISGSIIDICNMINAENINEVVLTYKLPYDFVRLKYKDLLNDQIRSTILSYSELNCILRHWESFNTEENTTTVIKRLNNGEIIEMPYGELMKRLNMLSEQGKSPLLVSKLLDIAETKLSSYQIDIEQPVVVLGDASGSMEVAVKTSSIITSILVKICNAKMHLFRDKDEPILNPPTNVFEVMETMKKFKACGCTAPAASLYPYYDKKEIVKTFIVVTDEVENTDYKGKNSNKEGLFADVFKKYREEVYPAKLVFVSFLDSNKDGQMVVDLKQTIPGIEKDIVQFIMAGQNPDLRKLDELLNTLSLDTDFYNNKCTKLTEKIQLCNKENLFTKQAVTDMLLNNNMVFEGKINICI